MVEIHSNIDKEGEVISEIEDTEKKLSKRKEVKVGFFSDARYSEGSKPYVASVAMWQEFQGVKNKNKPARPFMREAVQASKDDVIRLMRGYPDNPDNTLKIVGESVKAAIQKSITTGNWAPLAKSTIARRRKGRDGKRSDKPLLDTGYLRSAVTYNVDE